MDKAHILVVEDSEITLFKLKAVLLRLGYSVTTSPAASEAFEWLKQSKEPPNLIISDVVMPGMDGLEFIRQVRAIPAIAKIPIILLTGQTDMENRVAGMQAGADDYVAKTISPTELELRIKALLARAETEQTFSQITAKIITVFSLRGGVGTTSIAANLAIALAHLWDTRVCLWDLALSSGHCAFFLNLKPKGTLTSLAEWPEDSVEEKILADMLMKHESGIELMPAPQTASEAELVTARVVDLVFPSLVSNFAFLVVDGGNHFTDAVLTLLERSDIILLMLAPELASVRAALDAMQIFEKLGYDPAKVLPVVSCNFTADRLPLKRIESALKKPVYIEIPYDSPLFIQAIHSGRPFMVTDPKSEVGLALTTLAYKLSSSEMESAGKKA
jgi:pilus assembly protein CpaE